MNPAAANELAADRERVLREFDVSRETAARLDAFVALLQTWQNTTNLIAPSTLPALWQRHIADSLQLLRLAPVPGIWIDFGSGGGFPGMVIACAFNPPAVVHLVESNGKKAAFLREAARVTGAPAKIHNLRVEDFNQQFQGHADIVTARALAPLHELLGFCVPHIKMGAQALLPKGQDIADELTKAAKYWKIDAELKESLTDPKARILIVRGLERTGPAA
jgi:16S rRNA (guanine527-N7)-methyltransferase